MIGIVILNYNSVSDCSKCVSSLKRQKDILYEIIIVDNCSNPEDVEQLRLLCQIEKCTLLESKENRGYNAGNNLGLCYAASKGYEFVLIANPDMEFPQINYLAALVKKIETNESIAITSSDIITKEGIHQNPMKPDGNWRSSFNWVKDIFKKQKTDISSFVDDYSNSHYCEKVSGCCFLIRVSFFKSINFFDEYPFLYCEEAILARQVEFANKKMYYNADIQAVHCHVSSTKEDMIQRFKHWKRSRIYYYKQYSKDSYIGNLIAILSVHLYVGMIFLYTKFDKVRH
ncbi:MAG: glycosyltransferase family 2 protein [Tannerella sp.]|jgi:GT2 family glycosyltransferase|nr:glycosyltransferase family 2 protein [Tannerella sp.]